MKIIYSYTLTLQIKKTSRNINSLFRRMKREKSKIQMNGDRLFSQVYSLFRWKNAMDWFHMSPSIVRSNETSGIYRVRGISLSGSYQQGYSTTYNTQSRIKVVCNGYILAHILNCNSWDDPRTLPSKDELSSDMTHGRERPICMLVRCARVSITAFWHGFWLRGVQPLSDRW